MEWQLYSFVVRSKQRKAIILALRTPMTPTEIGHKTDIRPSHVSRTLSEFKEKGLVTCLTPEAKIGRVYELTKAGKEVLAELESKS